MQVQNRRTLDTLYHTLYADEIKMMEESEHEESLYHHGVEGMSWGDRNGPPYPLGGVDKKVARAEYKAKKEKERRLKKLQRAAKKARKVKAKNAKQEAEILKKKQKLVKDGDLDKIRKNANLFTNEELQYVIERDNQKRALGSKDERTADEKFELAMKRMAQIGDIAANAGKVLSAAKTGADLLTSFKTAKVKDLEAEDKRLSAIKTEFEMRFKGREDSPEAQRFINATVNNEQYEPSKVEKKEVKQLEKDRMRELKDADKRYKDKQKAEKQAEKEADPKYQKKQVEKEQKEQTKEAEKQAERDKKIAKREYEAREKQEDRAEKERQRMMEKAIDERRKIDKRLADVKEREAKKYEKYVEKLDARSAKELERAQQRRMDQAERIRDREQEELDRAVKEFSKGLKDSTAWRNVAKETAEEQRTKQLFIDNLGENLGVSIGSIYSSGYGSYTNSGSDWVTSFFSSNYRPKR